MIRNKKFLYILSAGLFLMSTGCKKYLDVNKNVNSPTSVPTATLITSAELAIGNNMAMSSGLSDVLSVYMHQHTTRETPDQYNTKGTDGRITGPWDGLYGAIIDLNVVINQGTTENNLGYVGIAKILKAYAFSMMVDVWGDLPYSEFDQFKAGIKQPKFDKGSDIYPKLFALIDEGVTNLNATVINPTPPAAADVIYQGNKTKWTKAANTIKLKMYTQLRKIQNVTPQVTALLATPANLINQASESFLLPYGPNGATDDRNPAFADYVASQRGFNVSPWLYEIMKGINPVFSGITDPRVPYYWYNQKSATAGADNGTDYRDGGFISIYFGSLGPNRNFAQQNSYTLFGIYPVGGRYDDGAGVAIPNASASNFATGAAPYRFITYADRLYLEAELINAGVITGDARAVFSAAMSASMAMVDYVITTYVKPTQTVPALGAQTTYINAILAKYDAGTAAQKLEYIMTEKWLQSFGSNIDQYTDYRRTGYPVLFDPKNATMAPGGFAQPPIHGNPAKDPQDKVAVTRVNDYPLSLPFSQSEIELNKNALPQKSPSTYKVFWMP